MGGGDADLERVYAGAQDPVVDLGARLQRSRLRGTGRVDVGEDQRRQLGRFALLLPAELDPFRLAIEEC